MRCEAGKDVYSVPPIGILQGVVVERENTGFSVQLSLINQEQMIGLKSIERRGTPTRVALMENGRAGALLQVEPTPNTDGVLRVRYYPPLCEI